MARRDVVEISQETETKRGVMRTTRPSMAEISQETATKRSVRRPNARMKKRPKRRSANKRKRKLRSVKRGSATSNESATEIALNQDSDRSSAQSTHSERKEEAPPGTPREHSRERIKPTLPSRHGEPDEEDQDAKIDGTSDSGQSMTPSENILEHKKLIGDYEAMRQAARNRGNQKEVDRCSRQIEVHRHAITEHKPVSERRAIYTGQIKRLTEEVDTLKDVFAKQEGTFRKELLGKEEKIAEFRDLLAGLDGEEVKDSDALLAQVIRGIEGLKADPAVQQSFSAAILARLGVDPYVPEHAPLFGQPPKSFSASTSRASSADAKLLAEKDAKIRDLRESQKRSEQAELKAQQQLHNANEKARFAVEQNRWLNEEAVAEAANAARAKQQLINAQTQHSGITAQYAQKEAQLKMKEQELISTASKVAQECEAKKNLAEAQTCFARQEEEAAQQAVQNAAKAQGDQMQGGELELQLQQRRLKYEVQTFEQDRELKLSELRQQEVSVGRIHDIKRQEIDAQKSAVLCNLKQGQQAKEYAVQYVRQEEQECFHKINAEKEEAEHAVHSAHAHRAFVVESLGTEVSAYRASEEALCRERDRVSHEMHCLGLQESRFDEILQADRFDMMEES